MFLWLYCVRQLEEALRDSLSYHMPTAVLDFLRAEPGVPAAFRGAARLFSAKMTAATISAVTQMQAIADDADADPGAPAPRRDQNPPRT